MRCKPLTRDALMEQLQRETFGYFLHETNPVNGLVIDKTAENWPASIAATGLASERVNSFETVGSRVQCSFATSLGA
ncbi:hypothetical protein DFR29_12137 [Tahibacter aquaticus]|uniref:Uncharacterized protein n=1 Tax=Tahibacter aquaticus TaxID=520092 RepID=A0A4R6YM04_9GAMM|nr:hypothetical protein [Tahibacter aquaticus]TDR38365.1 hypothetical protein DFR29_12137 [Tahibacter aquaticus]